MPNRRRVITWHNGDQNLWSHWQRETAFQQRRIVNQLYGGRQPADRIQHWFRNKYVDHYLKHDHTVRVDTILFCMHNGDAGFMYGVSQKYAHSFVVLVNLTVIVWFTYFKDCFLDFGLCRWRIYNYTHSLCIYNMTVAYVCAYSDAYFFIPACARSLIVNDLVGSFVVIPISFISLCKNNGKIDQVLMKQSWRVSVRKSESHEWTKSC